MTNTPKSIHGAGQDGRRLSWHALAVAALCVTLVSCGVATPVPSADVPLVQTSASAIAPGRYASLDQKNACFAALNRAGVHYTPIGSIPGRGRCGVENAVEVHSVDGVVLSPAPRINCRTAMRLYGWVAREVQPAANRTIGHDVTEWKVAASYACRTRNHKRGARLSEHSFGNAIDISAFVFADGREVPVKPRRRLGGREAAFQKRTRERACAHFETVLGPGSDAYHNHHFHLDAAERRSGYRHCE